MLSSDLIVPSLRLPLFWVRHPQVLSHFRVGQTHGPADAGISGPEEHDLRVGAGARRGAASSSAAFSCCLEARILTAGYGERTVLTDVSLYRQPITSYRSTDVARCLGLLLQSPVAR